MSSDEGQGPLRPELAALFERRARASDAGRPEALARRHRRGARSARENLADLVDEGSFLEYGELAVAAQRSRRDYVELQRETAADGVITGIGRIGSASFGMTRSRCAIAVYDYAVLAGTQGFFHHAKLDRIADISRSASACP
jgi:acetyl-CoA carboxylase carboxyltransferase component